MAYLPLSYHNHFPLIKSNKLLGLKYPSHYISVACDKILKLRLFNANILSLPKIYSLLHTLTINFQHSTTYNPQPEERKHSVKKNKKQSKQNRKNCKNNETCKQQTHARVMYIHIHADEKDLRYNFNHHVGFYFLFCCVLNLFLLYAVMPTFGKLKHV